MFRCLAPLNGTRPERHSAAHEDPTHPFLLRRRMYPFPQNVTPAIRTHMDAQTAFVNDIAKSMFRSFQQMCDLNIQLVQTLMEETTTASQQMLTADRQTE